MFNCEWSSSSSSSSSSPSSPSPSAAPPPLSLSSYILLLSWLPLILASLLIFAFTREAFRLRQRTPAFSKVEKKKKEQRRDRRDPNGI